MGMTAADLARLVEQDIRNGKYLSGSTIPSEYAMASEHKVSRNMVREAYAMLIGKGLIEKRKSFGTFVR